MCIYKRTNCPASVRPSVRPRGWGGDWPRAIGRWINIIFRYENRTDVWKKVIGGVWGVCVGEGGESMGRGRRATIKKLYAKTKGCKTKTGAVADWERGRQRSRGEASRYPG